jgi:hypothetical protein
MSQASTGRQKRAVGTESPGPPPLTLAEVQARYPQLPASTLKFMRQAGRVRAERDPAKRGQFLFDAADLARELDGRIFRQPPPDGNLDRIEHAGRPLVRVQAIPALYGFSLAGVAAWQRRGHAALGGERLEVYRVQFVGLIGPPRDYADAGQLERIKASLDPAAAPNSLDPDPDHIGLPEAITAGLITAEEASLYADCGMHPRAHAPRNSPALTDGEHPDGRPIRAGNRLVIRNGRQVREGWLSRGDLAKHVADLPRPGWLTDSEVKALDGLGLRLEVSSEEGRRGELAVLGCRVAVRRAYARIVANRTSRTGPPGNWQRVWLFKLSDLRPVFKQIKAAVAKERAYIDGRGDLWLAEPDAGRLYGLSPTWLKRAWLAGRIGRTMMRPRKGGADGKPGVFICRVWDIQTCVDMGPESTVVERGRGGWSPDTDLVTRRRAADLLEVQPDWITVAVAADPSLAESTARGSRVYLTKMREHLERNARGRRRCERLRARGEQRLIDEGPRGASRPWAK